MDELYWDPEVMLDRYIYDYMLKKNLHVTAQVFKDEAKIPEGPFAIDDSPWGFLLEWWLLFSDMYFKRQSSYVAQQAINEVTLVRPINQEPLSRVLDSRTSVEDSCPHTQLLQPNMMLPGASLLPQGEDSPLPVFPTSHHQGRKRKHPLADCLADMDEMQITQSNFLEGMQQNMQQMGTNGMDMSNFPTYLLRQWSHSQIYHIQQTEVKCPYATAPIPFELCGSMKDILPTANLPETGQTMLSNWPFSEMSPIPAIMEQMGLGPTSVSPAQMQQPQLSIHQREQMLLQGGHAPIMRCPTQSLICNCTAINPLAYNLMGDDFIRKENQNETSRKGKEPLFSETETSSQFGDIAGPSKVTPPSPTSPPHDTSISRTMSDSVAYAEIRDIQSPNGEGESDGISKPMGELVKVNDGSIENKKESQCNPETDDNNRRIRSSDNEENSPSDGKKANIKVEPVE